MTDSSRGEPPNSGILWNTIICNEGGQGTCIVDCNGSASHTVCHEMYKGLSGPENQDKEYTVLSVNIITWLYKLRGNLIFIETRYEYEFQIKTRELIILFCIVNYNINMILFVVASIFK